MNPLVVINDPRRRQSLQITAPGGFGAGFPVLNDEFQITVRYWNFCNPYDDPAVAGPPADPINGDFPPVERTALIRIIQSPNPPTVNNPIQCESDGNGNFNITATGVGAGGLTYTWYDTDPTLGPANVLQGPAADNTFNPVTEGPAGLRINKNVAVSTVFNRFVTVTQGSNACTSEPQTITIRIDAFNTPGSISHPLGGSPITICNGDDPVAFNSVAGLGGGPGAVTNYQWQHSTSAGGTYFDLAGATSATYNPTPADINLRRFFRRRVRSGQCADVFSNIIEFRVDNPVTGGSINGTQTICETPGNPGNLSNAGLPTGGAFTGTFAYQWEESTVSALGPFNTIGGATGTSYNPPAGVTVTTHYRRRVTSGVCPGGNVAYSNVVTVTVDQDVVPGAINNPQTICSGQVPATIGQAAAPSGGDGVTYTFSWEQSATGGGAGFGPAAGPNPINGPHL